MSEINFDNFIVACLLYQMVGMLVNSFCEVCGIFLKISTFMIV